MENNNRTAPSEAEIEATVRGLVERHLQELMNENDDESMFTREFRMRLIDQVRHRLDEETPRVQLMQEQLQETRELVRAYKKNADKVRDSINFVQMMTEAANQRIERIAITRNERTAELMKKRFP
ncbi:hypothetical protein KR009_010604 [Drosophila setifemur]|nr:hypothetical protein KR009_010604 [Drosophila setifemur]